MFSILSFFFGMSYVNSSLEYLAEAGVRAQTD